MDAIWGSRGEGGFVRTALECRKLCKEPAGGRDGADRARAWRCRQSPRGAAGGARREWAGRLRRGHPDPRQRGAGAAPPGVFRWGAARCDTPGVRTDGVIIRRRAPAGRGGGDAEPLAGGGDALCSGRWRLCTGVRAPHHVSQWIKTCAQRRA